LEDGGVGVWSIGAETDANPEEVLKTSKFLGE
jgi:hypothetical protein